MVEHEAWLRVERGTATDEEIAALVTVLSAVQRARLQRVETRPPASAWARAARAGQRWPQALPPVGPEAWRSSALVRS